MADYIRIQPEPEKPIVVNPDNSVITIVLDEGASLVSAPDNVIVKTAEEERK